MWCIEPPNHLETQNGLSLEGVPNVWHRMHSSKTRAPGRISTLAERSWRPTPNPSSGDQDPALLTFRAVPPRGWGSGTLPSQLSLVSYLVALGPAPPSGRWDAARGEKSGKKLAEAWGPASLPSPPPIRGWRGRRHACALLASSRLQRGGDVVVGGGG